MLAAQNGLEEVVRMLPAAEVNIKPKSPYQLTAVGC